MDADTETWHDAQEIHRLKARYCRFIDTKQWARLAELFSPDAQFEGFGSAPPGADVATFVRGVSTRLADCISVHHCHTPDLIFQTPTSARCIWGMEDHLEWTVPLELKEAPGAAGFHGYGYYEDAYSMRGGVWKILFSRLTRLRVDPLPASPNIGFGALRANLADAATSADWLSGAGIAATT